MTHRLDIHRKLVLRLTVAVLGASPLLVRGSQPATQPVSDAPPQSVPQASVPQTQTAPTDKPIERPGGNAGGGMGGDELPGNRVRPGQRTMQLQPSPKEMADAMQFLQANSPKRYDFLNSLPDSQQKNRMKKVATATYLQIMETQRDEPTLYGVALERMKLEDDIFGLAGEMHKTPADKQDALKSQLRSKVSDLVNVGLKERQLRLKFLQTTVEKEQKDLARDNSDVETLVEKRYAEVLREEARPGAFNGGGGPRGHGGPRQPGEGNPPQ